MRANDCRVHFSGRSNPKTRIDRDGGSYRFVRAKKRKSKAIRLLRIALMVVLVGGTAGFATLWLIFQHKPDWYRPPPVNERMLRDARSEVAEIVEGISHRIVRGETFELSFTDETVNQWLAALPHVWPGARRNVPPELRDLVIRFEDGRIRIASLYVKGGWRAVLTVAVEVGLSKDGRRVSLQLIEAHGGSLPVPHSVLVYMLGGLAIGGADTVIRSGDPPKPHKPGTAADWLSGLRVPNRFVWPNGKRPFRIDAIELTQGRIRLRLESL